jgi:aspartyl-tRNA(Asn)/glutamyl-tRNA(Gln) amidotransferase subunit C
MITLEEIKKLATLARIELSPEEAEKMTKEIDSILEYVGQVQKIGKGEEGETPLLRNVMREDIVTHTPGEYTEKLLSNAPFRKGMLLKVKKIL